MRELNRHVVEQQAAHWEVLGLELGLKDYQIANISKDNEHNPSRSVACCKAVLQKWLDMDSLATWDKLDNTIKKITQLATGPASSDKGGNYGYYKGSDTIQNYVDGCQDSGIRNLN